MPTINIKIRNKIAICPKRYVISANSNYSVEFDFDEEWTDEIKTVRFFFDSTSVDLVFTGTRAAIPKIPACTSFGVGVYTDKLSSTVAEIGCIISTADSDCEQAFEFTKSQYDQIVELLNELHMKQVKSVQRIGNSIVVKYTNDTSDSFELHDGTSIKDAKLNGDAELEITLTDNSVIKCGSISAKKGKWILLNDVTITETVDEVTISKTSEGKSFSVDELAIRADFKKCSDASEATNVNYRESRLPSTPLSVQGIFENAVRATSDNTKIAYMKNAGLGNCFSVHTPKTIVTYGNVAMSQIISEAMTGIAGVTFTVASDAGHILAGTRFRLYGRD